jgi:hypothetical protein
MTANSDDKFDFKRLLIKSPVEEFENYARKRLRAAEKLKDSDYDILLEAVELGVKLLKEEEQ